MKKVIMIICFCIFGGGALANCDEKLEILFFGKQIEIENKYYLLGFENYPNGSTSITYSLKHSFRKHEKFSTITFFENESNIREGLNQLLPYAINTTEEKVCGYSVLTVYMKETVTSLVFKEDERDYISIFGESLEGYNQLMKSLCKTQ